MRGTSRPMVHFPLKDTVVRRRPKYHLIESAFLPALDRPRPREFIRRAQATAAILQLLDRLASHLRTAACGLPIIKHSWRTIVVEKKPAAKPAGFRGCESMRNITVSINDDAYRRARVWAARRDMSASHLVRSILEDLPGFIRIFAPSLALESDSKYRLHELHC